MIDTYAVSHYSGPCGNVPFVTTHLQWANRTRIQIASGERIRITLYGHGADLAQDATGSNIHEWITDRGTTTDYPGAPIMFGQLVSKGYVTIDVRAAHDHGLGNRTIRVKWLTGNEQLDLKIVSSCTEFTGTMRQERVGGGTFVTPPRGGTGTPLPNLLPYVSPNSVLTRPVNQQVIPTLRGGMRQVASFFASGLSENVVTAVPVPKLTWGVSGVNIELAKTQFDAQLIDVTNVSNPRVLDTLSLPQGFPANTPLVTKTNYPGRPTSIRVVKNPRFQVDHDDDPNTDPLRQTYVGCFTEPGSTQALDPMALLLVVDSANRVSEGRENDNELRF
jgi:hypothetical protein